MEAILISRGFTPREIEDEFEELDILKFLAAWPAIQEMEGAVHARGIGMAFQGK